MTKYSPSGFNQKEIDSKDQHVWRIERDILYNRIRSFCNKNEIGIHCGNGYSLNVNDVHRMPYDKIIYSQLFDLIPNVNDFDRCNTKLIKEGKQLFVISDNIVVGNEILNFSNITFFDCKELLGTTASYEQDYLSNSSPTKLFSCFIQRTESVRQSWFYFLHAYNLLDKGYVSYLLKQLKDYSNLRDKELFEFIHYNYELNKLPHFQDAFQTLYNKVPYRNFKETYNLMDYIVDAKYSLDLDTFAVEDDAGVFCWTEKILRPLQMPIIPLMFCQKDSFSILQKLGFELPAEILYLDSMTWVHRQQELFSFILEDKIEWDFELQKNRAIHNRELLSNWKQTYQKDNYFEEIFEIILNT